MKGVRSGCRGGRGAQLAVLVLRERWRRSSVGEKTTDIITARITAENVCASMRPSRRAVVAVMKANSPHADMARPTVITSFLRSGTTHRPVASLPSTAMKRMHAWPMTVRSPKSRTGTWLGL